MRLRQNLSPRLTCPLRLTCPHGYHERAFERLIPQGHTFRIVDTTDLFSIELDTVEDFENARRLIPQALW